DPGSARAGTLDDERPTDFLQSLLHHAETEASPARSQLLRPQSLPVIRDHDLQLSLVLPEQHVYIPGSGVTLDVQQRFAGDFVQALHQPRRERFGQILVDADLDARLRERSEEHTSELQSRSDLVCRLLLEKKKKNK